MYFFITTFSQKLDIKDYKIKLLEEFTLKVGIKLKFG